MKAKIVFSFAAVLVALCGVAQQRIVSVESELQRMLQTGDLPVYLKGTTVNQVSSYDRKGKNNDGFEGTYSFIRKNDDGSLVVFEAAGKGVIERIWTPTPTDDTLDFYFDGSTKPSYSIRFRDLFSGKISPFLNPVTGQKVGGWYSYLPIPYADGCKVVLRGKKMLFYQIQYRSYDDASKMITFDPDLTPKAVKTLTALNSKWASGKPALTEHSNEAVSVLTKESTLKPGQTLELARITRGGRIVGIELDPANALEGLSNAIDLKITWDDDKQSAVFAPVADFFGYAFGTRSMQSLLIGANSQFAYCYIPMPFDKAARVELVYREGTGSRQPVTIKSRISWSARKREATNEGKFYAYWKRESPGAGTPYVFLAGKGAGQYIGTILLGQATSFDRHTEFFEGDDSTVLDDKNLLHGTGSEDYFNGGWYAQPNGWVERKGAPLHGCLEYSLPLSRTGGYRFYVLDKLPFSKSIYHSIEHGPEENNRPVEYTSVAMYYANAAIASGVAPTNATTRIFVTDTFSFYPRLMDYVKYEGAAKLTNGNATVQKGEEGVFTIDTKEVPPGRYKLVAFGKGTTGWNIEIPDGTILSESKTVSADANGGLKNFELGSVEVKRNQDPIRIKVRAGTENPEIHIFHLMKQ